MGKRSNFERRKSDTYDTPKEETAKLLPYLPNGTRFVDPCAGCGKLIDALVEAGHICVGAVDIEPRRSDIARGNLMTTEFPEEMDQFITNFPWPHPGQKGDPALSMILRCIEHAPVWCLLPADFMQNVYFQRVSRYCRLIFGVGRVSWMENGVRGKENAAWYLFDKANRSQTVFLPQRAA